MTHADCAWSLLPLGAKGARPPSPLRAPLQRRPRSAGAERGKTPTLGLRRAGKPSVPTATPGQAGTETVYSAPARVSGVPSPLRTRLRSCLRLGEGHAVVYSGARRARALLCFASTFQTTLSPPVPPFPRPE